MQVFSVFDAKAGVFTAPFVAVNDQTAMRGFYHAANDPTLEICRFAPDFNLYHLGSFDETTGTFELLQPMRLLMNAGSCKQEVMPNAS